MLGIVTATLIAAAPADFELHAAASALISADIYALAAARNASASERLMLAGGVSLGLGAAKELIWDGALGNGTASWSDFGADVIGTAAGIGLSLFMDWLLEPKASTTTR